MSSAAFARVARARLFTLRPRLAVQHQLVKPSAAPVAAAGFATSSKRLSADPHGEESFEEFTARYDTHYPESMARDGRRRRARGGHSMAAQTRPTRENAYIRLANVCWWIFHRYEKEFDSVQDVFELQRNLNNAFAYDLVPAPSVIIAALRAARRVNDYPTAVRIFEGKIQPTNLRHI